MMTADSEIGDGDFAGAGSGHARPGRNLNLLEAAATERFEIEHGGGGSVDKKTHLRRANTDYDDGEAVAAFDGDLFGGGIGLCEQCAGKK